VRDLQYGGGLIDGQLAALLTLTFAVGRNAMALAYRAYPRSGPGLFVHFDPDLPF
jgi:hypothetical protein